MNDGFRKELLDMMREIQTVDCHSHTCLKSEYYRSGQRNLFNLMSYFERDIQSAMGKSSAQLYAEAQSDEERWRIFKGVRTD